MRKRLYFLLPDIPTTEQVVNELLLARIDESHIHILAKDGIPLGNLPEANLFQKSDFVHSVEQGLAVGGTTGVLAGLAAITFPPAGLILGGGALLGIALAGAGVGAWASGMIGASLPNSRLKTFETAIEDGQVLMMVDTPKERMEEISENVRKHHPEADVHGFEPTIPAFP